MHRLATMPGGWTPDTDGVIFIDQQPAPIVVLTAADTDIQSLVRAAATLPPSFPAVRVASLLQLQQQLTVDAYAEDILSRARVIVLRLLGGVAYWPYGLEVVKQSAIASGAKLVVVPGDDRPDPHLMSHSTVSLAIADRLWRYFTEGGLANTTHALQYAAAVGLCAQYDPPLPQSVPRVGPYPWASQDVTGKAAQPDGVPFPEVGLLFYRAHYLSGNTAPVEALCAALAQRQLTPKPLFVSSLREPEVQDQVAQQLPQAQLILNTTSFAIAQLDHADPSPALWHRLNVPVLQVILSGGTQDQWQQRWQGLSPRDMAMNVALPEVDGRIISRAVSFKAIATTSQQLETDVVTYRPVGDRVQFVADLAARWVRLRQTPPQARRIALILANYPNRDGRIANGVGLDTPASCIQVLAALQQAGYMVGDSPQTGDELIRQLTAGPTNDPEARELKSPNQGLALEDYWTYFQGLPEAVRQGVTERWQQLITATGGTIPVFGRQYGNIFVGIQPSRGYDADPSLSYHAPDLAPTHDYLAFYHWIRQAFDAHAVVHLGKHGNLEWLPGKSIALSENCYPEAAFGPLPHLYPFIVNDPGEGSQAKRRAQAVIIDHLTPPLTRAELYGPLLQLEAMVDEYYEAQSLDPGRLPAIRDRLMALLQQAQLDKDLGWASQSPQTAVNSSLLRGT